MPPRHPRSLVLAHSITYSPIKGSKKCLVLTYQHVCLLPGDESRGPQRDPASDSGELMSQLREFVAAQRASDPMFGKLVGASLVTAP